MNKDQTLQAILDETGVCSPSGIDAIRLGYEAGEKNEHERLKEVLEATCDSLQDYREQLDELLSNDTKITRNLRQFYKDQNEDALVKWRIIHSIWEEL